VRRPDIRGEDGFLLVTSVVLLAIMLTIGLAAIASVDSGQTRSREQRQRETSLNVAEGVLYSQSFTLARQWPGTETLATSMPVSCSQTALADATQQLRCPNPPALAAANALTPAAKAAANFTSLDAQADVTWETRVRDNGGSLDNSFVTASADATQSGTHAKTGEPYTCAGPCRWDVEGDGMWVQARAVVRGRPRNIVALVRREQFPERFPRNAVTAGSFEVTNSGNKTIIDAGNQSQVAVRCTTTASSCTDYNAGKNQVVPSTVVRDSNMPNAMDASQIERFKRAAQSAGTYHTTCPASLTGTVVFIDVAATTHCQDQNNATYNSAASPGIVIMPRGTMQMKGTYYGLIYMGNGQGSMGVVLTLAANAQVIGGVAIDGPGRLVAGSASGNRATISFASHAFDALQSYGTAGLVQNTWRELPPG